MVCCGAAPPPLPLPLLQEVHFPRYLTNDWLVRHRAHSVYIPQLVVVVAVTTKVVPMYLPVTSLASDLGDNGGEGGRGRREGKEEEGVVLAATWGLFSRLASGEPSTQHPVLLFIRIRCGVT